MNQVEAVMTAEQRTQVEAQLLQAGQLYFDIWNIGCFFLGKVVCSGR